LKVTREHLEARRGQIVLAALTCMGRRGVDGATMRDIAVEAGLSTGVLYRYFRDKEALIEAITELVTGPQARLIAELGGGSVVEAQDRLVDELFGILGHPQAETFARLGAALYGRSLDSEETRRLLLADLDALRGAWALLVRRWQEEGAVDPELDPDGVGRVVVAMLQGLLLQRALEPSLDLRPAREAVRALLNGRYRRARGRGRSGTHRSSVEGSA
jgi:TetR/AcrR family transcriptional regulator, transcriptional repressor of aconitase